MIGELHRHELGVATRRGDDLRGVEAAGAVDADHRDLGIGSSNGIAHARALHRGRLDEPGAGDA